MFISFRGQIVFLQVIMLSNLYIVNMRNNPYSDKVSKGLCEEVVSYAQT
jgi:hypothetical protein